MREEQKGNFGQLLLILGTKDFNSVQYHKEQSMELVALSVSLAVN
jgi:hypothetical protein